MCCSALHHWKLVLLMLSRVKYGGGAGLLLCSWFKVGWSRNNGHKKNMGKSSAKKFHYFRKALKWCMKKKEPDDSFYIHPNDTAIFYVYSHDISVRDFWVLVGHVLDVTQKRQTQVFSATLLQLNVWVWCLIALISSSYSAQLTSCL